MKFEFTGEQKMVDGVVVNRIRATRDFVLNRFADDKFNGACLVEIKKGDLGGWLENMNNLSQDDLDDFAWVMGDACVYGDARVSGSAIVCDSAKVYGSACVQDFALIKNEAQVCGNASIKHYATISGHAKVEGAQVSGHALICGHADVYNVTIEDDAEIYGNAYVHNDGDIDFFVLGCAVVCDNAKIVSSASGAYIYIYGKVAENAQIWNDVDVGHNATVMGYSKLYGHIDLKDDAIICFPEYDEMMCLYSNVPAVLGRNAYILDERDLVAFDLSFNHDRLTVSFYPDKERRIYMKIDDEGCGSLAWQIGNEGDLEQYIFEWIYRCCHGYDCGASLEATARLLMEMSRYAKSYFKQLEFEKAKRR